MIKALALFVIGGITVCYIYQIYMSWAEWFFKKSSVLFLFLINIPVKKNTLGIKPIRMPVITNRLYVTMWVLCFAIVFSFLFALISALTPTPLESVSVTPVVFLIVFYGLLHFCNSFVKDDNAQPPLNDDDFWDGAFKVFKLFK